MYKLKMHSQHLMLWELKKKQNQKCYRKVLKFVLFIAKLSLMSAQSELLFQDSFWRYVIERWTQDVHQTSFKMLKN